MSGSVSRLAGSRGRVLFGAASLVALLVLAGSAHAAPYVYVANADGAGPSDVSQFNVGSGGLLTALSPPTVAAGSTPAGVAVGADGKSVYVTNLDDNTVSQYSVGAGGKLSPKSPATVGAGDGPLGIAVSPNGKSVYVANSVSDHITHDNVSQYSVGAGGALTPKSPATVNTQGGDNPQAVAVAPDNKSVYVAQSCCAANSLAQFDAGSNGGLSPKSPATLAAPASGSALAVSPNGTSVYLAGYFGSTVGQYSVGTGGKLSPKSPATVAAASGTDALAVHPNGKSVYVVSSSGAVSQYSVGAGGKLSPKSPATVGAGSFPQGIAVSPDGKSVYVTNGTSNDVSQYDVDGAGRLSAKSPATVSGVDGPFGVALNPIGGPTSVSVAGATLVVTAGLGHTDNLAITRPLPGSLRVTNLAGGPYAGSEVVVGAGCTLIDSHTAKCNASGVNRIQASARDLGDKVVNSTGIQSSLYGEKGADMLVGGSSADSLTGGPDADVIKGMNGSDQLFARDLTSDTTINCDGGSTPGSTDKADLDLLPKDPNSVVVGCEAKNRH